MKIRIMLFILMMMVMPVSYAACYSELSVQHNLVVQGDFALSQTQIATYEHNFNDSSCVSTNTITPMSPSDIIVGLYNDGPIKTTSRCQIIRPVSPVVIR